MAKITVISLPRCLKCKHMYASMVQVGQMAFCNRCFMGEFGEEFMKAESYDIDPATNVYQKWITEYKKLGEK